MATVSRASVCSVLLRSSLSGVPQGLRDLRNGGENAGGQRPQLGEPSAGAPPGEPRGDPRALLGGPQTLHQQAGPGGAAFRASHLRLHSSLHVSGAQQTLKDRGQSQLVLLRRQTFKMVDETISIATPPTK